MPSKENALSQAAIRVVAPAGRRTTIATAVHQGVIAPFAIPHSRRAEAERLVTHAGVTHFRVAMRHSEGSAHTLDRRLSPGFVASQALTADA